MIVTYPEFEESDWKLFRKKMPNWQENYMARLCESYCQLLQSDELASNKFWELEKRIRNDKRKTGVIATMKCSELIFNIVSLINEGAITISDLDEFSDKLKDHVNRIIH